MGNHTMKLCMFLSKFRSISVEGNIRKVPSSFLLFLHREIWIVQEIEVY